ncbi:hypothetical protein CTEN210_12428 [Chaetoceros tenuissimus]|uniref:Proteasome alpha-type subunits domain-containing protein n=1 Tax=Chaetoceros tenuissimus TaxID=426638 RepID=A0AAD3H9U5_9STRA|nr:hypothetical protein CTEN210_12428 [Chaetoceros tenuissimus]
MKATILLLYSLLATCFCSTFAAHARKRPTVVVPQRSNPYDKQITTFDPQGQLLQLQYAQEAANKGSSAIFINFGDVIIAVLQNDLHSFYNQKTKMRNKSLYRIHDGMFAKMTGLQGDSRLLFQYLLQNSLQLSWSEGQAFESDEQGLIRQVPTLRVEQLANVCADVQHSLTTRPGARALAVDAVLFGIDGVRKGKDGQICNQLGLYKCHLSGVVDECNFCLVGSIMKDKALSQSCLEELDTIYKEKKYSLSDSMKRMASFIYKHQMNSVTSHGGDTTNETRARTGVDIYCLKVNPMCRGGIEIKSATCVSRDNIDEVVQLFEDSQ